MIKEKVEELQSVLEATKDAEVAHLERLNYRLSDAIREGCLVTGQKVGGWTDGETEACAMSAAVVAAKARGYM